LDRGQARPLALHAYCSKTGRDTKAMHGGRLRLSTIKFQKKNPTCRAFASQGNFTKSGIPTLQQHVSICLPKTQATFHDWWGTTNKRKYQSTLSYATRYACMMTHLYLTKYIMQDRTRGHFHSEPLITSPDLFFCLKFRAGVAQWHREPVPAMHYNIDENHPVFKKIDKGTVFVDSLKTGCFDLIFFKYKIKN
jgi:hypothetical protein